MMTMTMKSLATIMMTMKMMMGITNAEKRKQMIMAIHGLMTTIAVKSQDHQEEILLNAKKQKGRNKMKRKVRILYKRDKTPRLPPVIQTIMAIMVMRLMMRAMATMEMITAVNNLLFGIKSEMRIVNAFDLLVL